MISIGITGSFAVGKSSILNMLAQKNYKTFVADKIVAEFYQSEDIKKQIMKFHSSLKSFDKVLIAKLLFTDSAFKKQVTSLIHPYVEEELKNFIAKNKAEKIIFSEIPLLFEVGFEQYFDYIITVYCSEKNRLIRAKHRENFSFKKFRQIRKNQLTQIEKINLAHFAINTDINLLKLEKKIDQLIQRIECLPI